MSRTFEVEFGNKTAWAFESLKDIQNSKGELICIKGCVAAVRVESKGVNAQGKKIYDALIPLDDDFQKSLKMENLTGREFSGFFKKLR